MENTGATSDILEIDVDVESTQDLSAIFYIKAGTSNMNAEWLGFWTFPHINITKIYLNVWVSSSINQEIKANALNLGT